MREQCRLVALPRSRYYYVPHARHFEEELLAEIDRIYMARPYYGTRRIRAELNRKGMVIGRGRIGRYMRFMGYRAIYPKRNLSRANREHKIFPYLLRGVKVDHINQVWSTDTRFIPMSYGFAYLVVSWTGTAAMCWVGGCRRQWTRNFAWKFCGIPFFAGHPRYSILTRAASSQAMNLPAC
jgi:putative transposase